MDLLTYLAHSWPTLLRLRGDGSLPVPLEFTAEETAAAKASS